MHNRDVDIISLKQQKSSSLCIYNSIIVFENKIFLLFGKWEHFIMKYYNHQSENITF